MRVNLDTRAPFHCGLLAPECGNRSSSLNVASHFHCLSTFIMSDHMFSLNEVSDITFSIDTSHDKSTTGPPAILLGDQSKVKFLKRINLDGTNEQVTIDARDFEGSILEMLKIL